MNDHQIDFKHARVIDKGDYRVRKTLKSWHTAMTTEVDNNDRSLPRQYSILLKQFSLFMKFFFLSPYYAFLFCNFSHIFILYIYSFVPFLSFVKGCSLAAESLSLTKIFNQRTLQLIIISIN